MEKLQGKQKRLWSEMEWDERLSALYDFSEHAGEKDNELRTFVFREIIYPSGAKSRDYVAQIQAIFDWAQDEKNIYYITEAGEQLQTPAFTINQGFGDCDDYSILLAAMAYSIGFPFRFVLEGDGWRSTTGKNLPGEPYHIYVEIGADPFRDIGGAPVMSKKVTRFYVADASEPTEVLRPSNLAGKQIGPLMDGPGWGMVLSTGLIFTILALLWRNQK
jgi:transglutaminase-like putative cysteine protease